MSVSKETFENAKKYTKTMLNIVKLYLSPEKKRKQWLYAVILSLCFQDFGMFRVFRVWELDLGKKEHVMLDLRGSSGANGCFTAYMFHCEKYEKNVF